LTIYYAGLIDDVVDYTIVFNWFTVGYICSRRLLF